MRVDLNPFRRLMRTRFARDRVRRLIVDRAAQQLAPENQDFTTEDLEIDSIFSAEPFALYIHFPFCTAACSYCIFRKTLKTGLIDRYVNAVLAEIDLYADRSVLSGRRLSSVHLGGGTPSLVPPSRIDQVIGRLDRRFGFTDDAQVTLEGNPESLAPEAVPIYRRAGIDRISIGVQSLDDRLLRQMGRRHTSTDALDAIRGLQDAGFENLSVDLIYGFEGQTAEQLLANVGTLVDYGVPHLSAFPLIARSVRDVDRRERRRRDGLRGETYHALVETLERAGYERYSSEDFALQTESRSKYQIDAWRLPKRDVVALGAGAMGSANRCHYTNLARLDEYLAAVETGELPIARVSRVSAREEIRRSVLLGAKYIHVGRQAFLDRFGVELEQALEPLLGRFRRLGVWTVDRDGIHVTDDGLQIISEIWSELILANLAAAARTSRSSDESASYSPFTAAAL
jgi:oxygen-independent coproporphyrinogen-3 oxidase